MQDEELLEQEDSPFIGFEDEDDIEEDEDVVIQTVSPKFDYENKKLDIDPVGKAVIGNEIDAYRLWVTKSLLTERYKYLAYGEDFGTMFDEIIRSNLDRDIAESEVMREIEEALSIDERTLAIEDFNFEWNGSNLYVTFVIETTYGEEGVRLEMDGENIGQSRISFTSIP